MSNWADIYNRRVGLGEDHGSAAYAADQWEARQQRKSISISSVALHREGGHVFVEVEIDGLWREVIRERHDASFSHVVTASGIRSAGK